ncbi:hypothetical protein DSL72_000727 [Monilinia vaccinii-corymbosi]|uniref:Uncharacterized protein n=1 Tax=Monilinia vaccinii-corymbosi TaxID=61207 RepID=A0A8A3P4U1_9HELO|nr:hypothetical protein DSL72_000727 [Monilinia vaccinii-corymbosi]
MWLPRLSRNPPYTKLAHGSSGAEAEDHGHEGSRKRKGNVRWNIFLVLALCFSSGALGFVFARLLERRSVVSSVSVGPQFAKQPRTFAYNRDFSYPPSNATDAAWDGLFPGKGSSSSSKGFFNHPYAAGERATLSVLHQLHCLDAIRHIYYLNNDAATTATTLLLEEDLAPHLRSSHVRHCIDFLRQSLMCCGDSSIEKVDPELNVS